MTAIHYMGIEHLLPAKKSLLIKPSFVKPKKKTNVVNMSPCFVNSALLRAFFSELAFINGRPAFVRFSTISLYMNIVSMFC